MFRVISVSIGALVLMFHIPPMTAVQAGELQDAVKENDAPRVEALIAAGADINDSDMFGTALHMAAARGSLQMVNLLIDKGADLEAEASAGQRNAHPLHTAARANQAAVAELLVQRGAEIDARNGDGQTALIIAAHDGHLDVMRILINAGADFLAEDSKQHNAPIHYASAAGRLEIVKYLLSKGVDVNLRSGHNGETPLWWAVEGARMEMVEYLLANGAYPNIADNTGKKPAQISSVRAIRDMIVRLENK